MAKYLPKAERIFQQKLKALLTSELVLHSFDTSCDLWPAYYDKDAVFDEPFIVTYDYHEFDYCRVRELFFQYGNYLLLIEEDDDVSVEAESS
jgi:hypothetical protein